MQEESTSNAFIFACTNKSEPECLERKLLGTNKLYGDKALAVRKGDNLFLLNIESDDLTGPLRARSNGAKNIVEEAWNGKYPYQVRFDGKGKTTPRATKVLKRMGIDWRTPLSAEEAGALLRYVENPDNFDWAGAPPRTKALEVDGKPRVEATTLWDFPRQSYGKTPKGNNRYAGVTPAAVIYNMVKRYTEPGDLVVDPMAGSGTTLDVCLEENRRCVAFDINPTRPEITQNDARRIPLPDDSVDMIFIDSPYGDNIRYNEHPDNIGTISAETEEFYDELEKVMSESERILKPGKVIGWLIGDQWVKKKFTPVGFRIYERMSRHFEPLDIISVVRRSQSSNTGIWHNRALRFNFYLRGFKYLIIMKKQSAEPTKGDKRKVRWSDYDRTKH